MNLLTGHLAGLADFSGRENRRPYWLWIMIVYIAQAMVSTIVMMPLMASAINRMVSVAQSDPDHFHEHPELVMQAMTPLMSTMMTYMAIAAVVTVALIVAATVRRLHDGGHSGWWAAPVFAAQIAMPLIYAATMPKFLAALPAFRPGMTADQINAAMMPAMQSMSWVSLLGTITFLMVIVLIVFLALKGTEGPNRYGDDPLLR